MDHILSTLKKLDIFQIESLKGNYSWKYGGRVWVAVEAMRIVRSNAPQSTQTHEKYRLLDNDEYRNLPAGSDQPRAILALFEMTQAQADEPLVLLNVKKYDDCVRILNGRSIPHILATLRPVVRERLVDLKLAHTTHDLAARYSGHVLLATEAILRKNAPVSRREALKTDHAEHFNALNGTQKKEICDEMRIPV